MIALGFVRIGKSEGAGRLVELAACAEVAADRCGIARLGANNFQVSRRLRAMIENLLATLPESRQAALHRELRLLDQTLETLHAFPEDLALARKADLQGLGGSSAA